MDTCSAMVYGDYLNNKDEAHDVLSYFFDTEIEALRGRDTTEFEIILMSDLGEAHTNKIIKLCRKHGILKQSTAGYTPQHNAFGERWFRTVGEMSDLNCYNLIWRRSFGRILEDMPPGYTAGYHHCNMYLVNHGSHPYRNNTQKER